MNLLLLVVVVLVGIVTSEGHYYLPGVSPKTFQQYESVSIFFCLLLNSSRFQLNYLAGSFVCQQANLC